MPGQRTSVLPWPYVEALDVSATMTYTNFIERNDFGRTYSTYREL